MPTLVYIYIYIYVLYINNKHSTSVEKFLIRDREPCPVLRKSDKGGSVIGGDYCIFFTNYPKKTKLFEKIE